VEPRIVAGATRRPLQALLKGQLDLAIITSRVRDRRISQTPLFADEFTAVVAPDHPWAGKPFVVAEDFADQHVFLYNLTRAESTLMRDVLDPAGVAPARISRVELTEAILELVRAGLGVATLARWSVAPYVRSGALVTVPITRRGLHREWSAATPAHRETPEHLHAFIELLADIGDPAESDVGWRPAEARRSSNGTRARRASRAASPA
jgi:LysR family transcriptional regulator for metE and metH